MGYRHQAARDDSAYRATAKQIKALQILFRRVTHDRDQRLRWMSVLLGRDVATFNELTTGEAGLILDCAYPTGIPHVDPQFDLLINQVKDEELTHEPF